VGENNALTGPFKRIITEALVLKKVVAAVNILIRLQEFRQN